LDELAFSSVRFIGTVVGLASVPLHVPECCCAVQRAVENFCVVKGGVARLDEC
jgi:hypothetical protein